MSAQTREERDALIATLKEGDVVRITEDGAFVQGALTQSPCSSPVLLFGGYEFWITDLGLVNTTLEVIERAPDPFPTTPGAIIWAHAVAENPREWVLTDSSSSPWTAITGWGVQRIYAAERQLTLIEVRRVPGEVTA